MGVTQRLVKRLQKKKPDILEETVFSVGMGDVIECIAEVYEEKALSFSDSEIEELIEKGLKGLEWISWSEPIQHALLL